jgi:hypothetical protein
MQLSMLGLRRRMLTDIQHIQRAKHDNRNIVMYLKHYVLPNAYEKVNSVDLELLEHLTREL